MAEEDVNYSIPRGGPIYMPTLISPLTTVPFFESSVRQQLLDLEAELNWGSSELTDADDICVDELKTLRDEKLVEMALKEAFKGDEHSAEVSEKSSEERNKDALSENSGRGDDVFALVDSESGCPPRSRSKETATKMKNSSKRKRETNNYSVDNSWMAKVEELAKIKQKQDQDKSTARLHSLNCKINECVMPSSERVERMRSLRSIDSARKLKALDIGKLDPVSYPEVILCVEVYHNIRKSSKIQEFLVLGRQLLTELKDKIYCLTDQMMQKAELHDPSGYFLIEDVFCNDLRDPSAIDYSEPILDWLRNSKDDALKRWECIITGQLQQKQKAVLGTVTTTELPLFKAVDMQTTRFCDLKFRLGAAYFYCHQGDCNHTIVIRDMRLIHPEDVQNRTAYPIVVFQLKPRIEKCSVCKIYRATRKTVNDARAPKNPCYFCDHCYSLLHSEYGPLDNDFEVYDYLHD